MNVVRCIRLTKRKRELHNGEYAFNIDPRREYPLKEIMDIRKTDNKLAVGLAFMFVESEAELRLLLHINSTSMSRPRG